MSMTVCPHCTAPIPATRSRCPNCHTVRGPVRNTVHVAAVGAALLGLIACDNGDKTDTDRDEPVYGVSATQSESESDTQDTEETETDTEWDEPEYGVSDTES